MQQLADIIKLDQYSPGQTPMPIEQGRGPMTRSSPSYADEKTKQIGIYIHECFQMFDTYGRNIAIYIERFDKALANFNLDDVEYAFGKWFLVGKKLPVPANIIEIIEARAQRK